VVSPQNKWHQARLILSGSHAVNSFPTWTSVKRHLVGEF
jgi:hypothetical protein